MPLSAFDDLVSAQLASLDASHRLRARRPVRALDATHVEIDGRRLLNFASNNYLGLTHHPKLVAAARDAIACHGTGSGAAPLVTGHTDLHAAAERALAAWKGTDDAVLLPSGFQANHAAVGALAAIAGSAGRRIRFLLDKLAHASLIDAVRAAGAPFRVFPHNGVGKLRRLLADADAAELQVVVTESIFSMDGDAADLRAIADMKCAHTFLLLLDEAHAAGVYGPAGSGLAAEMGLRSAVDLSVVTLSKALGSIGGAVCGSHDLCRAIVNCARPYLFSTSLPPHVPAAVLAALDVLRVEPERQQRVRSVAARLRADLTYAGFEIPPGDSPIIPLILGSEESALTAAADLQARGYLVVPIRPPTVPRGSSRLRVTLSAAHTDDEVSGLVAALRAAVPRG